MKATHPKLLSIVGKSYPSSVWKCLHRLTQIHDLKTSVLYIILSWPSELAIKAFKCFKAFLPWKKQDINMNHKLCILVRWQWTGYNLDFALVSKEDTSIPHDILLAPHILCQHITIHNEKKITIIKLTQGKVLPYWSNYARIELRDKFICFVKITSRQ